MFNVPDAIPVEVEVLEAAQTMERARAQLLQVIVVEQQGAEPVQVPQHAILDVLNLVEPQVPEQTIHYVKIDETYTILELLDIAFTQGNEDETASPTIL